MENNNSKVFFAFAAVIGIGALIYALTRKNDQPSQQIAPVQRNWVKAENIGPEEYLIQPPPVSQEPRVLYQNEERIEIVRNVEGHISELVVHRRVTADG
jgi:hypothetical protein